MLVMYINDETGSLAKEYVLLLLWRGSLLCRKLKVESKMLLSVDRIELGYLGRMAKKAKRVLSRHWDAIGDPPDAKEKPP